MIIVHIKNNQCRSTESIYIQSLMYIILMENYDKRNADFNGNIKNQKLKRAIQKNYPEMLI